MGKPAKGRRDRLRADTRTSAPPPRQRGPLGDAFVLSATGKHMLRALVPHVDDDGIYRGSNAQAAAAAKMPPAAAEGALIELASRGFLKLRRARGSGNG